MKTSRFVVVCLFLSLLCASSSAQVRRKRSLSPKKTEVRRSLVVVDERLAAVRSAPGLSSRPIRRLRRGKVFTAGESKTGDGVIFFKVAVNSRSSGWVQSEAFLVKGKPGEDVRLFRLAETSDGFERIDRLRLFLEVCPDSPLRASALLLAGDLMEEVALKLSKDLAKRLRKPEMAASGAPVYSFYLNNVSLDRYVRLGFGFVFDESTSRLHYDGRAWQEIVRRFPSSPEAGEASRRLDALKERFADR